MIYVHLSAGACSVGCQTETNVVIVKETGLQSDQDIGAVENSNAVRAHLSPFQPEGWWGGGKFAN